MKRVGSEKGKGGERRGRRGRETTGGSKNLPNGFNKHNLEFVSSHMPYLGKLILE